jgi:hypothetical protein
MYIQLLWQVEPVMTLAAFAETSGSIGGAEDLDPVPNPEPAELTLRTTYRTERVTLAPAEEVGICKRRPW